MEREETGGCLGLSVGFPRGSVVKNLPASTGDASSIPGSGRLPGRGNGNPLQHSCLENPMDRRAWWAAVHGVTKSRARLNDFTFTFLFHALEKEMATHSSVLAGESQRPGSLVGCRVYGVSQSWIRLKRLSSSSSSP